MSLTDIETTHADYAKFKREADLIQIMMDEHALKLACKADEGGDNSFLKKPLSHVRSDKTKETALYLNYLEHSFLPEHIVSDAAEEMAGICFKVDPTINLPEKIAGIERHANANGDSLKAVAEQVIRDLIMTKKSAVSTDFIDDEAVIQHKPSASLVNWRKNSKGYTMMVFEESYTDSNGDSKPQRRHYSIESGTLVVTVYRNDGSGWALHIELDKKGKEVPQPSLPNKKEYEYIPIRVAETKKPALLGMARTVHKGFKLSAIYYGTLYGLSPTLIIKSEQSAEQLALGYENGIKLGKDDSAEILQQGTDGANPQKEAMTEMFDSAVDQGIRLMTEASGVEAHSTLYLRNANKQIKIDSIAREASIQIEEALRVAAILKNANPDEVKFELNVELVAEPVDIEQLKEMRAAVTESGLIKWSDYLKRMSSAGLITIEPDGDGVLDTETYITETLAESRLLVPDTEIDGI